MNKIIEIISNGSKWYGQQPDSIETLLQVIETETLDPRFEDYGNFINEYKPMKVTDNNQHLVGCTTIFGNFQKYSHVFRIITNDEKTIDKLTQAIRKNQQTEEYVQARIEYLAEKKLDEYAKKKFMDKEVSLQGLADLRNPYGAGKELYEQFKEELLTLV